VALEEKHTKEFEVAYKQTERLRLDNREGWIHAKPD
jgi:hypothetical protein